MNPLDSSENVRQLLLLALEAHHLKRDDSNGALMSLMDVLGPVVEALAERVAGALDQLQIGLARPEETFAAIATDVSGTLHRAICNPRAAVDGSLEKRACRRDTKLASDFIAMIAGTLCNLELEHAMLVDTAPALEAAGLDDGDVSRAVEARLSELLRPKWNTRTLRPIDRFKPILQINAAISNTNAKKYAARRDLAHALSAGLDVRYQIEITSDYVTPKTRDLTPSREDLVRAAIYRAACIVSLAEDGRFGTAQTWTLAEELMIPVLVLATSLSDLRSSRFPGEMTRRTNRIYNSPEEARRLTVEFLEENQTVIERRNARLAEFVESDISSLTSRLESAEPSLFDTSPLTRSRARWFVSDPIHWWQAPVETANEVCRITSMPEMHPRARTTPRKLAVNSTNRPPMPDSRDIGDPARALLRLGEARGLSPQRLSRLADAWAAEKSTAGVSARQDSSPATYDDWASLDDRLPGGAQ